MRDFFRTDEQAFKLLYHAARWKGTPWCANSDARGSGVSCHNLPRALYVEVGALPPSFPKITGDPNQTRHSKKSVMEPFIDARPEFRRLVPGEKRKPGDLLGLRIFRCIDHLGVVLNDTTFVHVMQHKNTAFDLLIDPTWSSRVGAVWRIVEL